jgi:peptidoglycan/xylan/chitin deacetylase (PgdA/CDA1 family)
MSSTLNVPPWPDGAQVAVAITFDVDAECGWLAEGEAYAKRLTTLSEARFGVTRGLPRILELLEDVGVGATFYVPGDTAERHPEKLTGLLDPRHEIGHHGHLHLRSDKVSPDDQRREVERGLEALDRHLGVRPRGYRSPSWEMTPETFDLLLEHGFAYDSSMMGDDRAYLERREDRSILELPVHWSLDDWPYFAWNLETEGNLASPERVLQVWMRELQNALLDGRLMTITMHPEVIGRGYRIDVLRSFIEGARTLGNVWFATHGQIADHIAARD